MLAIHAAGKPLAEDASLDALAARTEGMSGAALAGTTPAWVAPGAPLRALLEAIAALNLALARGCRRAAGSAAC